MLTDGRISQSGWKFTSSITAAFCASIALCAISGSAPAQDKIPQFTQKDLGWVSVGGFVEPPAGMRGPVGPHPAHAFHRNLHGPSPVTPPIGKWGDPVLKRCVSAHMEKT